MFYNFLTDEHLNQSRDAMGAQLIPSTALLYKNRVLTKEKLTRLLATGLSVYRDEITEKDHLLYYQDILISINISKIKEAYNTLPRLHIAKCTIVQKIFQSTEHKSVIACRQFHKKRNLQYYNNHNHFEKELDVCKFCLELLQWQKYHLKISESEKNKVVKLFQLQDFYQKYSKSTYNHLLNSIILSKNYTL